MNYFDGRDLLNNLTLSQIFEVITELPSGEFVLKDAICDVIMMEHNDEEIITALRKAGLLDELVGR